MQTISATVESAISYVMDEIKRDLAVWCRAQCGIRGQLSQGCASQITAPKATFSGAHNYPSAPSPNPFHRLPSEFHQGLN